VERRLFVLDHNFPQPIVEVLSEYMMEAELVALDAIDPRMTELDDGQVLLALHHDDRPWDGLITTDSSMVQLPRELAVLMQTKLTLVIADEAGHDPLKATGLSWLTCRASASERARASPRRGSCERLSALTPTREGCWRAWPATRVATPRPSTPRPSSLRRSSGTTHSRLPD